MRVLTVIHNALETLDSDGEEIPALVSDSEDDDVPFHAGPDSESSDSDSEGGG